MIILDATSESLEILLAGAVTTTQAPFTVSYADHNAATPSFTPGSSDGVTNNTTAVTLVAAPAASTQRQVKRINVYNDDTAAMMVTVRLNNGGTFRKIAVITILPGERIEYEDSVGFRVFDASGAIKQAQTLFQTGTYILAQRITTDQNLTVGVFTTVVFNNEVSDALNEYDPSTGEVTIKNTGRYLVSGYAQIKDGSDKSAQAVSIFRNGTEFMRIGGFPVYNTLAALGLSNQVGGATFVNLTVGDVITLRAFCAGAVLGGTLQAIAVSQLTNFSMMRVG